MFGLSIGHLLVVLGIILLFRARKIPELAENIGKSFMLFRRGLYGEKLKENSEKEKISSSESRVKVADAVLPANGNEFQGK